MAFDIAGAKKAGYSDSEIESYLRSKPKSVGGFAGNAVNDVKNLAGGVLDIGKKVVTGELPTNFNPASPSLYAQLLNKPQAYKNLLDTAVGGSKATVQEYMDLLSHPIQHTYEHPVNTALDILPLLKVGSKVPEGAGAVRHPKATTYSKIEAKAKAAGQVSKEAYQAKMGTVGEPNPKLFEKLTGSGGEAALKKIIGHEISTFESSGGTISDMSYSKLLNKRQGLYNEGKAAVGQRATPAQQVKQNIARAYSDLLKEGAGTAQLDKLYSALGKASGTGGAIKRIAEYALIWKLLGAIPGL